MRKLKYLTILLVVTLLSSCLLPEGDCAECSSPKLFLSYKDASGNELLNQYISSATLYFYDKKGYLVSTQDVLESQIKANEGINLDVLPVGQYRVIVWANGGNNTNFSNTMRLNNAFAEVKTQAAEQETADPLYYGSESILLTSGINTNVVVNLKSIHVKFSVTVKGLDKSHLPAFHISNVQSAYSFLGKPINSTPAALSPKALYDNDKKGFHTSFHFMKPKTQLTNLVLKLSHKQLVNDHSINLNEFIHNNYPDIDISNLNKEIKIDMLIEFDGVDVVLTIPNWDDTDTSTEVH